MAYVSAKISRAAMSRSRLRPMRLQSCLGLKGLYPSLLITCTYINYGTKSIMNDNAWILGTVGAALFYESDALTVVQTTETLNNN